MKTEGPPDVYGPFDEPGEIGIPGRRWPSRRPTISVKDFKEVLSRIPEDLFIALPLKASTLTILDRNGHYRGYASLTSKEINLWEPTV